MTAAISLRDRQRALTRTEILTAAAELFETERYHDLPIDAIARHAGVSRATFYLHFANKREVLDELIAPLREAGTTFWGQVHPDARSAAAIAPHVERFLDAVRANRGAFTAWMQAGDDIMATSRRDLDRVRYLVFGDALPAHEALARTVALVSVLERFCVYWLDHALPLAVPDAATAIASAMRPLLRLAPASKRG